MIHSLKSLGSLKDSDLSREELFALVWKRPTTEVARELEISDRLLAGFQLCWNMGCAGIVGAAPRREKAIDGAIAAGRPLLRWAYRRMLVTTTWKQEVRPHGRGR